VAGAEEDFSAEEPDFSEEPAFLAGGNWLVTIGGTRSR
jgi:hypothetical protein